jgi:hypothetical protein
MNAALFLRLQWEMFGDLDAIQVTSQLEDGSLQLSSFQNHAIAALPATINSIANLRVLIGTFERHHMHDLNEEEERYQPPEELIIHNEDNSAITMAQFVRELHQYIIQHKVELYELLPDELGDVYDSATDELIFTFTENTRIFFAGFMFEHVNSSGMPQVTVELWTMGWDGQSSEEFQKEKHLQIANLA